MLIGSSGSHSSSSGVPIMSSGPLSSTSPSPQNERKGTSILQRLEHPSLFTIFPSSHSSLSSTVARLQSRPASSTMPLPQTIFLHCEVHSFAQRFVTQLTEEGVGSPQTSTPPGIVVHVLPGSHCSLRSVRPCPFCTISSPQYSLSHTSLHPSRLRGAHVLVSFLGRQVSPSGQSRKFLHVSSVSEEQYELCVGQSYEVTQAKPLSHFLPSSHSSPSSSFIFPSPQPSGGVMILHCSVQKGTERADRSKGIR